MSSNADMKRECVEAVSAVIGRAVTPEESRAIKRAVREAMKAEARLDPKSWAAKPLRARFEAGAKRAAEKWVKDAEKQKQRLQQQLDAHDRVTGYVAEQIASGRDTDRLHAVSRLIAGESDGRNNSLSVESWAKSIFGQTMGDVVDAFEAIHPRLAGLLANREAELQMLAAMHGQVDGIRSEILRGAKAWLEATSALRARYNEAGGMVGKLDVWGLPHVWNAERALREGREAFVADFMRWVDRRKYVEENGAMWTDDRMRDFLGAAWTDVVTHGATQPLDWRQGPGVRANRHRPSRQIHLKDPLASRDALVKYAGGNVAEAMVAHLRTLSRDLALIEVFGPNADHTVAHFIDHYQRQEALLRPERTNATEHDAEKVATLYDAVAGNSAAPPSMRLATLGAAIRSWLVSTHLGSAAITALTDEGTLHLTAKVNNLPLLQVFTNELRAFNPADATEKRLANRAGLLVHTLSDSLNRFGTDTFGHEVPAKVAAFVMRASGLNAMTEARRRAFSVTMLDTIGSLTRRVARVEDLDPGDWRLLRDKGVTAEDWAVWRAATPDSWRGNDTVLTARNVMAAPGFTLAQRQRAATRLLGAVLEEQDTAVIEPGARERAFMRGQSKAGTGWGEFVRSFWMFKSFPTAMLMRHWKRGLRMYDSTEGKAGYLGTLIAAQTVLGAVALEINDVLLGKDPRTLDPRDEFGARNWVAAFLKGGSVGLYGDFLFSDTTSYGRSLWETASGPVGGFIGDAWDLTGGNARQLAEGEDTEFGAEATKMAKQYTPGRSLWYAKAALDRIIFSQLQEYFSEGYSERAAERARRNYGATYWWEPGEATPQRAPVLEAVVDDEAAQ